MRHIALFILFFTCVAAAETAADPAFEAKVEAAMHAKVQAFPLQMMLSDSALPTPLTAPW